MSDSPAVSGSAVRENVKASAIRFANTWQVRSIHSNWLTVWLMIGASPFTALAKGCLHKRCLRGSVFLQCGGRSEDILQDFKATQSSDMGLSVESLEGLCWDMERLILERERSSGTCDCAQLSLYAKEQALSYLAFR